MTFKFRIITCFFLIWFRPFAQHNLYEGFEFSNSIPEIYTTSEDKLIVYSSYSTCIVLKIPFRNIDKTYAISKNSYIIIEIDSISNYFDIEEVDSVVSVYYELFSVYPISMIKAQSSGSFGLGRKTLINDKSKGTKNILAHGRYNGGGAEGPVWLSLFSNEDQNTISIFTKHLMSYRLGGSNPVASLNNPGQILLSEGEATFVGASKEDDMLFGANATIIESTQPLAISIIDMGNLNNDLENKYPCATAKRDFQGSFPTYQNKPLTMAGTYYPFTPVNKQGKDYVHLLATRPNTNLYYNGQFVKTLDSLELWDTCFTQAGIISANKPLMFGQFVQRNALSAQPFEVFSIGVQTSDTLEYINKTIFDATPNTAYDSTVFPLNITAYTADTALLLHNGLPLQNPGWQPFSGNPNLSWCTYLVQPGVHVLESTSKFAALYYPHSFFNPPSYLYKEVSSYMLPGVTPTQEAADSIQFYYQATTGQKEPWANGPVAACSGVALTLYPNIARHTTWQWHFGDGTTQTQRTGNQRAKPINYTWQSPGQYWVTITDSAGCTAGDSLLVIVKDGPQAAFSYTANAGCSGTFVQLQNQSVGATSYNWQWPGGSSTAQNPSFVYSGRDTTLTVTLIATDGTCTYTTTQTLILNPSSFIPQQVPNVITPNNDGLNDAFCIPGTAGFAECFQLEIFNRWGTRVFATQNPHECWEPSNIAEGVYFYVLTLGQQRVQGEVTVF